MSGRVVPAPDRGGTQPLPLATEGETLTDRPIYDDPPIVEAICQFRFSDEAEWDLTIPGRLHERLQGDYGGKPRNQEVIQAELHRETSAVRMSQAIARVQLPNSDGSRLVAVGPGVLSVHVLKPYPGWEKFRARISRALEVYSEVTGQLEIVRIGLRYINRISLPQQSVELPKYFTCPPVTPDCFPAPIATILHRTESLYDDPQKRLVHTFASEKAGDPGSVFLVDLDVIWQGEALDSVEGALELTEDLRQKERLAFEALITDETRALFDA